MHISCQFFVFISCHFNFSCIILDHIHFRCTFYIMLISGVYFMSISGVHFRSYANFRCIIFHTVHFRCKFHVKSITSVYFISCQIHAYISCQFQLSVSCHVNFRCTFHVISISGVYFMPCQFQVYISSHANYMNELHEWISWMNELILFDMAVYKFTMYMLHIEGRPSYPSMTWGPTYMHSWLSPGRQILWCSG